MEIIQEINPCFHEMDKAYPFIDLRLREGGAAADVDFQAEIPLRDQLGNLVNPSAVTALIANPNFDQYWYPGIQEAGTLAGDPNFQHYQKLGLLPFGLFQLHQNVQMIQPQVTFDEFEASGFQSDNPIICELVARHKVNLFKLLEKGVNVNMDQSKVMITIGTPVSESPVKFVYNAFHYVLVVDGKENKAPENIIYGLWAEIEVGDLPKFVGLDMNVLKKAFIQMALPPAVRLSVKNLANLFWTGRANQILKKTEAES